MILAGGRVNELNVLTHYRPKSAVPFGGLYRVIDFALSNLMRSGLEQVAILSQFRSFSLINHIGIGAAWDMLGKSRGVSILPPSAGYGNTSWYKGTADAVYQNIDFIEYHNPEEVFILSGDHVYNMDYREMIAYHREKDADLTIACVQVPMDKAHRFGVADIDDEDGGQGGRVLQYKEKPDRPRCNWASLTVYCFRPKTLIDILKTNAKENSSFEFGRDIIPRLMYEQKRVYGYKFRGYWGYTRTMEEYWQTNMDLLGPAPKIDLEKWGVRTNMEHRDVGDCQPLKVGPSASIQDSLVYNGCVVEGTVERSILFPGVHVGKGSVVRDSVLFFNNKIGQDSRLEKVVSDVNVTIGNGAVIGDPGPAESKEVTVLGWNNFIPDKTVIGSDCTVFPALPAGKFSREIKTGETVR
ncbi:MAG: glucose-1-phosphate adenylyltransferase [Desulfobulbaceae bacterium]|uniref:Glucose-1-phosphate adenylyltransferase n=1 Tax=Candidatus Desulfobia pelagia TaxID=2841692 RepID=A0A8J6NC68_9BACT|nr:glucose-1-phosphate adenylyltransferase [Candidatus Desulfobia pelagia]